MNGATRRLMASVAVVGVVAATMLATGCASPPPPPPSPIAYVPVPAIPPATTIEDARKFLRRKPSGAAALKEAERYRAAGNREAVFLLVKYAARDRVPEAAYELGHMYDPATHAKGGVVLNPDVSTAASWFRWAARSGHVRAMVRLGEMYRDGVLGATGGASARSNGVPEALLELNATERGFYWLDKAAKAGGISQ